MQIAQCYILQIRSIKYNKKGDKIWDTQKNIEADAKWAQKREELVKEINENKNTLIF